MIRNKQRIWPHLIFAWTHIKGAVKMKVNQLWTCRLSTDISTIHNKFHWSSLVLKRRRPSSNGWRLVSDLLSDPNMRDEIIRIKELIWQFSRQRNQQVDHFIGYSSRTLATFNIRINAGWHRQFEYEITVSFPPWINLAPFQLRVTCPFWLLFGDSLVLVGFLFSLPRLRCDIGGVIGEAEIDKT